MQHTPACGVLLLLLLGNTHAETPSRLGPTPRTSSLSPVSTAADERDDDEGNKNKRERVPRLVTLGLCVMQQPGGWVVRPGLS